MRRLGTNVVAVAFMLAGCATMGPKIRSDGPRVTLYVNGQSNRKQSTLLGGYFPGRPFVVAPMVVWDNPTGTEGCPAYEVTYEIGGEVAAKSANAAECADPTHDSYTPQVARLGPGTWTITARLKTTTREYVEVMTVEVQ